MAKWRAVWGVLLLAGCGGSEGDSPSDGAVAADGEAAPDAVADGAPADATVDAVVDAAPDAAPPPDPGPVNDPAEAYALVDPFIGTGGLAGSFSALTPAAQLPNGLVKLGPDSSRGGANPPFLFGGYHYDFPDVRGFSHTHFVGTGVVDYGNLRVTPLADTAEPWDRFLPMDKATEAASPGVYTVHLTDPAVQVELTATLRGGLHRYTFAEGGRRYLAVDAAAAVADGVRDAAIDATPGGYEGYVVFGGSYTGRSRPFTLYFSATVDVPAAEVSTWNADGLQPDATSAQGVRAGALFAYDDVAGTPITMRVGVSMVDMDGARANLAEELDGRSFEDVSAAARDRWLDKLRRVRVAGGTDDDRRILFTAQYNVYRMPTRLDDVDGRYRGLDGEIHTADGFAYYSDLSLWDTFRTLHPWLALTDHELQIDCMKSLLAMARDGGCVPRWPAALSYTGGMIGESADVVFADSAVKGVPGIDYRAALAALKPTADAPPVGCPEGRNGIQRYLELGWVPADENGHAASVTLEYAYDDGALANLAEVAGEAADAARYRARSLNWRNVFDPETRFLRARNVDGSWTDLGNPIRGFDGGDYREGTAWNWRFYAPQDIEGMREALGGAEAWGELLEEMFSKSVLGKPGVPRTMLPDPYYWHGNEVDLHYPYLFAFTDRPHRGDHWVRDIQTRLYTVLKDGIPGNDDGGALSSWYLFSAAGVFPIAGFDRYILGNPLFPRMEITTAGGTLRVEAHAASHEARYTRRISRGDTRLEGRELRHADLLDTTLRFDLSATAPTE